MFKIGNQIKDNYEEINGLTYVETLKLEHIYTQYLVVFQFAGETPIPEALSQQQRELYHQMAQRCLRETVQKQQAKIDELNELVKGLVQWKASFK